MTDVKSLRETVQTWNTISKRFSGGIWVSMLLMPVITLQKHNVPHAQMCWILTRDLTGAPSILPKWQLWYVVRNTCIQSHLDGLGIDLCPITIGYSTHLLETAAPWLSLFAFWLLSKNECGIPAFCMYDLVANSAPLTVLFAHPPTSSTYVW